MKHFTLEEFKPKEQTLDMIRQIAYTYRATEKNTQVCYLN